MFYRKDFNPRRDLVREAFHVVTNPEDYADQPSLRVLAWGILKANRGQTIRQNKLQANRNEARKDMLKVSA